MKKIVPNENIVKLRELSEKLCENPNEEYKLIVKKLKTIVDAGKNEIEKSQSEKSKIKCYETMCSTITNLLSNVQFK
jgi:hypothetical protein